MPLHNAGPIPTRLKNIHNLARQTELGGSSARRQLRIILIATILWLPLQANGQSVFVGIDGCIHTSAEIDALWTSEHELSSIGAYYAPTAPVYADGFVGKRCDKSCHQGCLLANQTNPSGGTYAQPCDGSHSIRPPGLLYLDNDFAITFDRIAL